MKIASKIRSQLVPTGILRVGLNMANKLLVSSKNSRGEPDGVAPDIARALAKILDTDLALIEFPAPGDVADMSGRNCWDIGMIGAEPARAKVIDFSDAYVEIEATYLVPANSLFSKITDIDQEGVRVAVSGRSAYDLFLTRHLENATLMRAQGVAGAVELFIKDKLEALAGLRPALIVEAQKLSNTKILDGHFTAVQQAIGVQKGYSEAARFINQFVQESKNNGLVEKLIDKHGITGRLSVGST